MSNLMYALQLKEFSSSYQTSLKYEQTEKPKIKSPNEVLVRVKAAGVNPVEPKVAAGNMAPAKLMISFPAIIGGDFAGVIEAKGDNVNDFEIGDEVYGSLQLPFGLSGSFAQYTVVDTKKASIAKKPSGLSFEQAASAGIAFLTAYKGVVQFGHLESKEARKEKKTILVIGASGGVGGYAVQIAKAINPENTVIGICSAKNTEYAKSLGADKVINYDNDTYQSFITDSNQHVDIIFDSIGGADYHSQLGPLLTKKGVFATAVGPVQHSGATKLGALDFLSIGSKIAYQKLFSKHEYNFVSSLPHDKFRTDVAPLFESPYINNVVKEENIIPLSEGYKAFEKLMSHRVVGKIVLKVD